MAINFPDSPSVNDTHTVGDKTWTWDGTAWNVVVGGIPTTIDTLTINQDAEVDGILTANHIHGNIAGSVYLHVKNTSGSEIAAGTPVYATGSVGASGATEIAPSDASTSGTMPALGITQSTLAINAEGHATVLGVLGGQNTGSYSVNDSLYVAPGGGLTTTRPTAATDLVQKIARVVRADASTGEFLVLGAGRTNDVPNEISILGDLTVDTDTLHVDSTNNKVGIGTPSPTTPAHIYNASTNHVLLIESGDSTAGIAFKDSGTTGNYYDQTVEVVGDDMRIKTGGATRLTVDSSGKVGIGTTSPVPQLDMPDVSSTGTLFSSNGWGDAVRLQNSSILRWTKTSNKIWGIGQSTDHLYFGNTTAEGTSTSMAYHQVMYGDGQVSTPSNPFFNARSSGGWVYPGAGYTQLNSTAMGSAWTVGNTRGTYSFNTSTGVFTAPVSGVYLYSFSTYMITGTGGYIHPLLTIDGNPSWNASKTPYTINGYGINSTYSEGVQVSYTIYLSANQYIYPYFYFHTSSDGIYRDYTYYSVAFLG